jgi:hypothetical protein
MAKPISYPFVPKSTAYLRPGQFFAIELSYFDHPGWYSCGRVLEIDSSSTRWYLGGLTDWIDSRLPTLDDLPEAKLIEQSILHTRYNRFEILGHRALEEDGLEPLLWLGQTESNHKNPNKRPDLLRGLVFLREATIQEHQELRKKDMIRGWRGLGSTYRNKNLLAQLIETKSRSRRG